jgi:hypothetical protein
MAITANRDLKRYVDQELRSYGVAASQHIWKGALLGIERTTGYVRNLVAGDVFAGVAYEEIDNSAGAAAAKNVRCYTQGDFILAVNNATQASAGSLVFALDNEVTGTSTSQGASHCGILLGMISASQGIVRIEPMNVPRIEHALDIVLVSSTGGATTNPVMITQRAIKITGAQVSFNSIPNSGNLDVGTDNSDPDEVIDAFNLATLTPNTPAALTPVSRDVAKNVRLWAKVGQATTTAGTGGILSVRYIELP